MNYFPCIKQLVCQFLSVAQFIVIQTTKSASLSYSCSVYTDSKDCLPFLQLLSLYRQQRLPPFPTVAQFIQTAAKSASLSVSCSVYTDSKDCLPFLQLLSLYRQQQRVPPFPIALKGLFVCWLVACLTSQQQAGVSQGRICSDNFTCCHTEIEVADQTFYLTQSQYTDTGPTSPSAWQGSHWSANF